MKGNSTYIVGQAKVISIDLDDINANDNDAQITKQKTKMTPKTKVNWLLRYPMLQLA